MKNIESFYFKNVFVTVAWSFINKKYIFSILCYLKHLSLLKLISWLQTKYCNFFKLFIRVIFYKGRSSCSTFLFEFILHKLLKNNQFQSLTHISQVKQLAFNLFQQFIHNLYLVFRIKKDRTKHHLSFMIYNPIMYMSRASKRRRHKTEK